MRLSALLLLAAALLAAPARAAKYEIRWVLVHDHSDAVKQAAHDFADRLEKETGGDIHVEILTRRQYVSKYRHGRSVGPTNVMTDVAKGRIEMSQTYTHLVAERYDPQLHVLGLPYLFRDYDHAEKVFTGPIGAKLLASIRTSSPLTGLAFGYSGGFGVLATRKIEVHSPDDLSGLRMQLMMKSGVSAAIAARLGFNGIEFPPEAYATLAQNDLVDGLETTYTCIVGYKDEDDAKIITDTAHFLLTTTIVINSAFLDGLPPKYQALVRDAAADTARAERRASIAMLARYRRELASRGSKIIDLTPEERRAFEQALQPVYADADRWVPRALVEEVRAAAGPAPAAQTAAAR